MDLTDEQINAALRVWYEEASPAYMARVSDYVPEGLAPGPEKDAAFAALRAADEEADRQNRDLMRRAIKAALERE